MCQKWVNENPDKTTQKAIAEGLEEVYHLPDAELGQLSMHLSGQRSMSSPSKGRSRDQEDDPISAGPLRCFSKERPGSMACAILA